MSFREMAAQREQEASQLQDDEIWASIVSKFVLLEFPVKNKAEMLLQACGNDQEIIEKALQSCVTSSIINQDQASEMIAAVKDLASS